MKKIEFTKEWFTENKLAIRCWSLDEANKMCDILDIENTYHKQEREWISDGKFVDVDNVHEDYNSIMASEVIAKYEASNCKIIGYMCPFDMFGGRIKKDTLYCKFDDIHYTPKDYELSAVFLPREIVETWEPVYEEVKPCFGSWGDVMQFAHKNQTTVLVHANNRINFGNIGDATQEKYSFTDEFKEELKALSIWI